jgi:transcriptional regulator with XRE-family HTH domain
VGTIGERAVKEIKKRAVKNGISLSQEASKIEIGSSNLSEWKKSRNPNAYFLQQMALAGYDVIYILTGRESGACNG